MAAKRIEYQIVGRYKDGKEVTDYHLQSIDTGKSAKFSKEIVCYLAGRGQITNCTAQIYKDQVILRGNGMSLDDLPIINEDGALKNADGLGKVRKGTSAIEALEMFNIVGVVKSGRSIAGYVLQNAGCGIKKFKRTQVIEMAKAGKIGNARVQMSNGREILRGIDCKLDELPIEKVNESAEKTVNSNILDNRITRQDIDTKVEIYEALKLVADGANKSIGLNFKANEHINNSDTQECYEYIDDSFVDKNGRNIKLQITTHKQIGRCRFSVIGVPTENGKPLEYNVGASLSSLGLVKRAIKDINRILIENNLKESK